MPKRTVLESQEYAPDGTLMLRFLKQELDDDGNVIEGKTGYHRTSVPPGGDIDAQIAAVNEHLTKGLGFPAVEDTPDDVPMPNISDVRARAAVEWTLQKRTVFADRYEVETGISIHEEVGAAKPRK